MQLERNHTNNIELILSTLYTRINTYLQLPYEDTRTLYFKYLEIYVQLIIIRQGLVAKT